MNDLINGFIDRIRAEFYRIFKPATDIYVIGYRANDELFKEMMSYVSAGTKLHVVGRETARDIQSDLVQNIPKLVAGEVHTDGFIEFIKTMH